MANPFKYKPSKYGTNYQDIYTTGGPDDGTGGRGGRGGGGGGGQGGRNFQGNGSGDNLKFRKGGDGPDRFRMMNMMSPPDRDVFGMERGVPETMQAERMTRPEMMRGGRQQPDMTGGGMNLQQQIASLLDPNLFARFKDGTAYSQDEQARRMLGGGNANGSQLNQQQIDAKAMMYGNHYGLTDPRQQFLAQNPRQADSYNKLMSGQIGDQSGIRLDVDTYGHGPDGQTLNAKKVLRQIEKGKLPPPPPPPKRGR